MARSLDVYLHRNLVGTLIQDNTGEISFQYTAQWLNHPQATALSQSLPLRQQSYSRRECSGFFGGILPEGQNRDIIARNLGISAKNDVAMLEQIGGECAGAVTFISSGMNLPDRKYEYRLLTEPELADILRELPRRPLLAGKEHIRLSLAGAQDKLAVSFADGQIAIPLDGAPSTHIIKPALGPFDGLVYNELLCMRLAEAMGLPTASVTINKAEEIDYLQIERYDRSRVALPSLKRLHQEDFCQAMGIVSEHKYQNEGGPSFQQCFQLLRNVSSVPAIDIGRLLDALIFNFLIGNNDAHGKNFSLLYDDNSPRPVKTSLAPLYDLVCTAYYPEISTKMAMKIGGEYESAKVFPRNFERLAEETGLSKPMVKRRIPSLARAMKSTLSEITPEHPVGIGVAELIRNRCDRTIEMFR